MSRICSACNGPMKELFTGMYCPNDCDRPKAQQSQQLRYVAYMTYNTVAARDLEYAHMCVIPPSANDAFSDDTYVTAEGAFRIRFLLDKPLNGSPIGYLKPGTTILEMKKIDPPIAANVIAGVLRSVQWNVP